MHRVLLVADAGSLVSGLRSIYVQVPSQPRHQKSADLELDALIALAISIPWAASDFPLEIWRRERPDFLIRAGGREIGVEHTEAVSQNIAHELALRAEGHGPDSYVAVRRPSRFNEPTLSRKEILESIHHPRQFPSMGHEIERCWVQAMVGFAGRKTASAKKDGYQAYAENWLLIYDRWRPSCGDYDIALPQLTHALGEGNTWDTFSAVYIVGKRAVVEVTSSEAVLIHDKAELLGGIQ